MGDDIRSIETQVEAIVVDVDDNIEALRDNVRSMKHLITSEVSALRNEMSLRIEGRNGADSGSLKAVRG